MAKMTRADLKRRRRIERYKKMIIYGFLVMTIFPIFTSCFLLYKIGKLEKQVEYVLGQNGQDYLTLRSSREALLGNTNGNGVFFVDSKKMLLGNSDVDTKKAQNTEEAKNDNSSFWDSNTSGIVQKVDVATKTESKGRVYLTFDDGPSVYTGQILDVLKVNDVKATFFVIGREEEYYDYYKRIVDEGHTIGMHSYTHVYQDFYASLEQFGNEISELDQLIYDVTGVHTKVFRFPGGSSNHVSALPIEEYISYLNEHNINYYDWNSLNGDAVTAGLSPQTLVDNIMKDVRCNDDSIVLMHDLQTTHSTVESLQLLIDTLKSEGYEILAIDENTPLIQHVSCNSVEE